MDEREQQRKIRHGWRCYATRGGHGERRGDVPLLRDQPADVLQVAPPVRGGRRGGSAGPVEPAADLSASDRR